MTDLRDLVRQRAVERAYERHYGQPWDDGSDEGHAEARQWVTADDAIEAMTDVLRPMFNPHSEPT